MPALVLDTSIVRALGAREVDPAILAAVREAAVGIHLAEGCMGELIHQLVTGRFPWKEWELARQELLEVLDHDEPVRLGGPLGLHRSGLLSRRSVTPREIAVELEECESGWTIIVSARRRVDLVNTKIKLPGQKKTVSFSEKGVRQVHGELREGWAKDFADTRKKVERALDLNALLPSKNDSRQAFEICLEVMRSKADQGRKRFIPPASIRLDAYHRVDALLHARHWRAKDAYNPVKHANDAFDHELLKYCAMRAMVCFRDEGLRNKVVQARSWQIRWLPRYEELAAPDTLAEIRTMQWPE